SHNVAWTFNTRGSDVSHTPLPLSYAVVPKSGRPTIFIDHRKLSNVTRDHLERNADVADRKSTRLNSSHVKISYVVFCMKKKIKCTIGGILTVTDAAICRTWRQSHAVARIFKGRCTCTGNNASCYCLQPAAT